MPDKLLSITDLHTVFPFEKGTVRPAVNGVSISVSAGETVAIVGESGSGKSMTALSVLRLIPGSGKISSGSIIFDGKELTKLSEQQMRTIRGSRISMIFQEPMTSLNPVLKIGVQLTEPLILHRNLSQKDAETEAIALLGKVGISSPSSRMHDYPHQLSGGMRQRVMIAMALACSPSLLIADEPTTALDVTIQAQILELLDSLRRSSNMAIMLITHDLGIVAERAEHTCVMYAGRIVESAPTRSLLDNPHHPYTQGLLASLPQNAKPGEQLASIAGHPASAGSSAGCDFYNRCPVASVECAGTVQELREITTGHLVRCWKCHE